MTDTDWTYDGLCKILRDELPLTMTLSLVKILIERMVIERMFAERVGGVVAAVKSIAERAVKVTYPCAGAGNNRCFAQVQERGEFCERCSFDTA